MNNIQFVCSFWTLSSELKVKQKFRFHPKFQSTFLHNIIKFQTYISNIKTERIERYSIFVYFEC